jgi:thioredoxin-related protein
MKFFRMIILMMMFSGILQAKTGVIIGGEAHTMLPWFKNSFLEIADDVSEANEVGKHVLLFFHLDGCPYCNQMVKDFDKRPLKAFIQKHFDVIAVNIRGDKEVAINEDESLTEKELAMKVGVQYTPTIVFLNHKNKAAARTNGYRKPEKFKEALSYVRNKAYTDSTLSQYIEKNKKADTYQLQERPMFKEVVNFSKIKTPLSVIFEDKNCDACVYFHNTTLKDKTIANEFDAFNVVRFDAGSTRAIMNNKGKQTTPKDWAQQLKLNYRPGIVLFDKGREITRIDGFLYPFHFKEVLRYVSGGFYQEFETFGRYLTYRQKQLLEQGIDINIGK